MDKDQGHKEAHCTDAMLGGLSCGIRACSVTASCVPQARASSSATMVLLAPASQDRSSAWMPRRTSSKASAAVQPLQPVLQMRDPAGPLQAHRSPPDLFGALGGRVSCDSQAGIAAADLTLDGGCTKTSLNAAAEAETAAASAMRRRRCSSRYLCAQAFWTQRACRTHSTSTTMLTLVLSGLMASYMWLRLPPGLMTALVRCSPMRQDYVINTSRCLAVAD